MTTDNYIEYFNEIYGDSLKCFWDERGLAARYRNIPIGVERFLKKNPEIIGKELSIEDAMGVVKSYLLKEGLAKNVNVTSENQFVDIIKLEIDGCIHRSIEDKLWDRYGIRPIACTCGNLMMAALDQGAKYDTEMAKVMCNENNKCEILIACFVPPVED